MAQTIHCDEHGLCIAQCELCVDEKHEREIAELERKLEIARVALAACANMADDFDDYSGPKGALKATASKALEEIK